MHQNGTTKLVEEMRELSQVLAKRKAHPEEQLDRRIEEGIADVFASIVFVQEELNLSEEFIMEQAQKKHNLLTQKGDA